MSDNLYTLKQHNAKWKNIEKKLRKAKKLRDELESDMKSYLVTKALNIEILRKELNEQTNEMKRIESEITSKYLEYDVNENAPTHEPSVYENTIEDVVVDEVDEVVEIVDENESEDVENVQEEEVTEEDVHKSKKSFMQRLGWT